MFLKTGTKWQEIQKSELKTIKPNELFKIFFSHFILSRRALFKLLNCFAIPRNFNFAVNLVTSFSQQKKKTVKSNNRKTCDFLEYKVLPSCKV